MDDKFVIAEKYAEALFEYSKEHSLIEDIKAGLDLIKAITDLNSGFLYWLSVPVIPESERKALIQEVVDRFSLNPAIAWFLFILLEKKRIRFFEEIYSKFLVLYNTYHHRIDVELITARPLSDSERQLFLHIWGSYLGRWIELKESIDENIIGGIKVYYKGWLYDGSIAKRLELLREELTR